MYSSDEDLLIAAETPLSHSNGLQRETLTLLAFAVILRVGATSVFVCDY